MKFFLAILLIVGTSVGAGMLGLPVETAGGGFFPAVSLFFLCWAMMILSGRVFAEVLVKYKSGSNFITLTQEILGNKMTKVVFIFYLMLFFSLITAYTKGIGLLIGEQFLFNSNFCSCFFIISMLPLLYFGANTIGYINAALTLILFAFYVLLIAISVRYIDFSYFYRISWKGSVSSLSLIITSFAFHGTLPSIVSYLDRDLVKVRRAIFWGSTITLCIYLFWQAVVIGCVPFTGEISLTSAYLLDQTAIAPMGKLFKHSYLRIVALIFSIASITTSFLGVSLGLIDFLMDAFELRESKNGRLFILVVVYALALILSFTTLRIFYISLNYGAGIASIFLLIFLPTLLHRFSKQKESFSGAIAVVDSRAWIQYLLIGFSFFAIMSSIFL